MADFIEKKPTYALLVLTICNRSRKFFIIVPKVAGERMKTFASVPVHTGRPRHPAAPAPRRPAAGAGARVRAEAEATVHQGLAGDVFFL